MFLLLLNLVLISEEIVIRKDTLIFSVYLVIYIIYRYGNYEVLNGIVRKVNKFRIKFYLYFFFVKCF